jgi:hypothetical protein
MVVKGRLRLNGIPEDSEVRIHLSERLIAGEVQTEQ